MGLTRDEYDTTISYNYGDETMTFSTSDPKHMRYIERLGYQPERVSLIEKEPVAWVYKLPKECFKLPRPKKRVSEAQRKAAGDRLRQTRMAL